MSVHFASVYVSVSLFFFLMGCTPLRILEAPLYRYHEETCSCTGALFEVRYSREKFQERRVFIPSKPLITIDMPVHE